MAPSSPPASAGRHLDLDLDFQPRDLEKADVCCLHPLALASGTSLRPLWGTVCLGQRCMALAGLKGPGHGAQRPSRSRLRWPVRPWSRRQSRGATGRPKAGASKAYGNRSGF